MKIFGRHTDKDALALKVAVASFVVGNLLTASMPEWVKSAIWRKALALPQELVDVLQALVAGID